MTVFATGEVTEAANDSFFGNFVSQEWAPLVFFIIFLALTSIIVISGVEKELRMSADSLCQFLLCLRL